jgi:hypothetical protein
MPEKRNGKKGLRGRLMRLTKIIIICFHFFMLWVFAAALIILGCYYVYNYPYFSLKLIGLIVSGVVALIGNAQRIVTKLIDKLNSPTASKKSSDNIQNQTNITGSIKNRWEHIKKVVF